MAEGGTDALLLALKAAGVGAGDDVLVPANTYIATALAVSFGFRAVVLIAAALYLVASLGFWGGIVFNDSLLLHVAEPEEYDLVSGYGYALGYLGGGPKVDPEAVEVRVDAERMRDLHLALAGMLGRVVDQHVAGLLRHGVGDLPLEVELLLPADAQGPFQAMRRTGDRRLGGRFLCTLRGVGKSGERKSVGGFYPSIQVLFVNIKFLLEIQPTNRFTWHIHFDYSVKTTGPGHKPFIQSFRVVGGSDIQHTVDLILAIQQTK